MFKYKLVSVLALSTMFLSACGGYKVGDQFTLKDWVYGGYSINDFKEAMEDVDVMGENTDISNLESIPEGEEVEIIKVSKKYNMFLLQHIDPDTGEKIEIWVSKESIDKAS